MDPVGKKFPIVYKPGPADFKARVLGFCILMLVFLGLVFVIFLIEKARFSGFFFAVFFGFVFCLEAWAAIRSSCKEIRLEEDKIVVIRRHKTEEMAWDDLKRIWLDSAYWRYKGNITLLHGKSELIRGKIGIPRQYKIVDDILDLARQRGIPVSAKPMSTIGG